MSVKFYYQLFKKLYHNGRFKALNTKISFDDSQREIIREINNSGIFIRENFLSADECDRMRNRLDEIIDSKTSDFYKTISEKVTTGNEFKFGVPQEFMDIKLWTDRNISDIRIIKSENISKEFNNLATMAEFLQMGEAITKQNLKLNFQMANRVSFVENNLGSGGGWHRDNNYSHGFKVLVYLDDVTSNSGPFEYLPGSHTLRSHFAYSKKIDQYQFTDGEIQELIRANKLKTRVVVAKKGSAVFFNTNGIHRGQPIVNGRRYAVTNYYNT